MRFTTNLSPLSPTQPRHNAGTVTYRGVTFDTNTTELFIDGQVGRRLVPELGSLVYLRATAIRYAENNTGAIQESIALVITNQNGTLSIVDQDSGVGGSQPNIPYAFTVTTRNNITLGLDLANTNSYAFDVVQGTPGFIRLQVRSANALRNNWEIRVDFTEATALGG